MVECRVDDAEAIELAAVVNDPGTERALQAGRSRAPSAPPAARPSVRTLSCVATS
jgi:hypothetical protein